MGLNSEEIELMTREQAYAYARFSLVAFMEKGQISEELMKNMLREIYWNFGQIPKGSIEEDAQIRYDKLIASRTS